MKPTYKPSLRRRKRQHGFLARKKKKTGEAIIKRRRKAGRKRLTPKGTERRFKRHRKQHTKA